MRIPLSSAAWLRLAGLGSALVALALIALGGRCMLPTMVSCAPGTILGGPPLDVPYKGTRREVVTLMLDMAQVRSGERVIDLGTGDGRILIAAAQRGATGLGVDLDAVLIGRAQAAAERAGVGDRVRFVAGDLFDTDLRAADVVTLYLLPEVNRRLRPRLLAQLRPGARVVSHDYDMGDWRPDATARVGGSTVYLWRVPDPTELAPEPAPADRRSGGSAPR